MPHNYVPEMTNSGLSPTQKVLVKDEYKNTRELSIAEELNSHGMITCLTKQHDLKTIRRNSSVKGIHPHLILSTGTSDEDYKRLNEIMKECSFFEFICIDIANGYIKELVENEKRSGIAHLLTDKKGNPIPFFCTNNMKYDPNNLDHIDIVLDRDGFTDRYDPQWGSCGKKSVYTNMRKWISNWGSVGTVSDITPFSGDLKARLEKSKFFKLKTSDGLQGHIVDLYHTTGAAQKIFCYMLSLLLLSN